MRYSSPEDDIFGRNACPMPSNLFSFPKLFQIACIACFPLFMVCMMTWGFVDALPVFDNEFTSETLLVCGVGYLIISAIFYNSRPQLFTLFFIIGRDSLLAGIAAYYYLWNYSPYPPEWM